MVSIKNIFSFFACGLVFCIVNLPSGLLLGLNFKVLFWVGCAVFLFVFLVRKQRLANNSFYLLLHFALCLLFLFLYVVVGVGTAVPEFVNTEFKLFFAFFSIVMIFLVAMREEAITPQLLVKSIFYSALFYSVVKFFLMVGVFLGFIDLAFLSGFIIESFGVRPMLLPVFDGVSRFQLANDYIVGFVLFYLLSLEEVFSFLKRYLYWVSLFFLSVAVIFSFSRYLFLVFAFSLIFYFNPFLGFKKSKYLVLMLSLSFIGFFVVYYFSQIYELVSLRFFSEHNVSSDDVRVVQRECLLDGFRERVWFGHGLGGFDTSCPAADEAPFAYESQYFGYIYKFGLVGSFLASLLYLFPLCSVFTGRIDKSVCVSLVAILLWLLVGFYNPYLISGFAATVVLLIVGCRKSFSHGMRGY